MKLELEIGEWILWTTHQSWKWLRIHQPKLCYFRRQITKEFFLRHRHICNYGYMENPIWILKFHKTSRWPSIQSQQKVLWNYISRVKYRQMCRCLKKNSLDKSEIQPCSSACSVQDCHFSTPGHRELKLVSSRLKYLNLLDSDDKNGLIKRLLGILNSMALQ